MVLITKCHNSHKHSQSPLSTLSHNNLSVSIMPGNAYCQSGDISYIINTNYCGWLLLPAVVAAVPVVAAVRCCVVVGGGG